MSKKKAGARQSADPQTSFDFTPHPTMLVGCRIDGQIAHFEIEAMSYASAVDAVKYVYPQATAIVLKTK